MPVSAVFKTITDEQLRRFAALIYARTGIRISPHKKNMLSNRLRRRLRARGIDCYDVYFEQLQELVWQANPLAVSS